MRLGWAGLCWSCHARHRLLSGLVRNTFHQMFRDRKHMLRCLRCCGCCCLCLDRLIFEAFFRLSSCYSGCFSDLRENGFLRCQLSCTPCCCCCCMPSKLGCFVCCLFCCGHRCGLYEYFEVSFLLAGLLLDRFPHHSSSRLLLRRSSGRLGRSRDFDFRWVTRWCLFCCCGCLLSLRDFHFDDGCCGSLMSDGLDNFLDVTAFIESIGRCLICCIRLALLGLSLRRGFFARRIRRCSNVLHDGKLRGRLRCLFCCLASFFRILIRCFINRVLHTLGDRFRRRLALPCESVRCSGGDRGFDSFLCTVPNPM